MALQIGSWGLPEFGLTEKIGNLFGVPTNPTGGSNIFGQYSMTPQQQGTVNYVNQTQTPTGQSTLRGGSVLGTSTTTTGGGTTGTTGTNPSPTSPTAPTQDSGMSSLLAEIDNIYGQTMGLANERESMLRANQPGVEADVQGQYASSQQSLGTEKAAGERTLTTAETQAGQTKDNALNAGRRLYNELSMGGQQRFGGSSSAGQAYNELTGREFQRGQATTQQAYQNAITKVTDLKANLQERFDSAMFNLETQKNNSLNEVRRMFQEKLSEIDSLRAEAGINKSTQRLQLLQDLRNQVYQINLASVQTQTALNAQKTNSEAQLKAVQDAVTSSNTSSAQTLSYQNQQSPTNLDTAYNITSGGQTQATTPTGISGKKWNPLTGRYE